MRMLEAQRRVAEAKTLRELKTHKSMATRLTGTELVTQLRVGEEERVFGAVTSANIADMLAEKGINIDRRNIDLSDPIKALGVYNVPVKLHADVTAFVKVRVEKEEESA